MHCELVPACFTVQFNQCKANQRVWILLSCFIVNFLDNRGHSHGLYPGAECPDIQNGDGGGGGGALPASCSHSKSIEEASV